MSHKIGNSPPTPDPKGPQKIKPIGKKPFPVEDSTTTFMGMKVTQAQKQKIYANLCNMIMSQMKKDAARQKKAAEALKRSIQGTE